MEDILVPLGVFTMVVAIVALNVLGANSRRKAVLETVREAVRSGQELSPETIRALGVEPGKRNNGDLKSGAILLAVAAGLIVLGWAIAMVEGGGMDSEIMFIMTAVAAFPGFIGIVLLMFGLFGQKKNEQD